jgi:hypothetical protein
MLVVLLSNLQVQIVLTMDIESNLFVEVLNHILAMKFKLHVHLLLME